MKFIAAIFLTLCICSCNNQKEIRKPVANKFSDSLLVIINSLADQRNDSALSKFLQSGNSLYRKEAALAFASFGERIDFKNLVLLLEDSSEDVRIAAAYSLGQSQNEMALDSMNARHFIEPSEGVRAQLMESVGRQIYSTIPSMELNEIQKRVNTKIYSFLLAQFPKSEIETVGWAKAMMWINKAEQYDGAWTDRMWSVFKESSGEGRLMCAIAMARSRGTWMNSKSKLLSELAKSESDFRVKAALMTVMGKMDNEKCKPDLLSSVYDSGNDPAIRIAAVRALGKQKSIRASELLAVLKDPNDYVVLEALAVLKSLDCSMVADSVISSFENRSALIKAEALAIALKHNHESALSILIKSLKEADSAIERTYYIRAFGNAQDEKTIRENVIPFLNAVDQPSLASAAADALAAFVSVKKGGADFSEVIQAAFANGDAGVMAVLATMLYDEANNFKTKNMDTQFLHDALPKLPLPKEIETYNEIVKAINYLENKNMEPAVAGHNHPIDWEHVKTIDPKQRVEIFTTKGKILVELKVEDSPGSVSNFLKLAEQKFFDGKIFHRVVPNFVIQAGCPRGDGWGSTDYTIRSEFGLHNYTAGAMGMASAGPDTESCQWFITHLPTPHLEGRYTIFGYVVEGQDVVNKIGIGDEIISVTIL